MKILVVDDDSTERRIVARRFGGAGGHQVIAAVSGEAAIALVADDDFDLVMMDIRMPGIDGLEATRRIRAQGGLMPIVAMSGVHMGEALCRAAGITRFVLKDHISLDLLNELAVPGSHRTGPMGPVPRVVAATQEADDHETAAVSEDSKAEGGGGFVLSRAALWGVMISLPMTIFTGTWFIATQAADIRHNAEKATDANAELVKHAVAADGAITKNSDALAKLEHDQDDLIKHIDLRLARMEEQMGFIVKTARR